jgi:hypothetical protein
VTNSKREEAFSLFKPAKACRIGGQPGNFRGCPAAVAERVVLVASAWECQLGNLGSPAKAGVGAFLG